MMSATVFQSDAPLDERRVIIRRHDGDVEMVELPWGLRPRDGDAHAVTVVRAEGRTFPTHRCLVPASEFRHKSFSFSLANGDWFYFAGIWRPETEDWPEAYAILTIEASANLAPFHDRQMAVLRRDQRLAWLDGLLLEHEILRPLSAGTFRVTRHSPSPVQPMLSI
ncbi:SOS response-associated peptidase family protein [Rhizobium bangladeshense]|uniref:SOS response-associated peptidase family protein n=1 Tax=Rhizobium bangladeshense TaxID=1138189 RepID=UPI001C837548|nr:SOS response-associated peptidase [Rhizobium bangladeshense]MBX4899423.1 SOS response-associated peptidase [Rhizobium bangladeshense]MBY3617636.1 SOS response-associated peptidase [Rhizobium bangladeshense]